MVSGARREPTPKEKGRLHSHQVDRPKLLEYPKSDRTPSGPLSRLSEFHFFGPALAEGMGYSAEEFEDAFAESRARQNVEALQTNALGTVVLAFMGEREGMPWRDTPERLLQVLSEKALAMGVKTEPRTGWPQASNVLTRRMRDFEVNLGEAGVKVGFSVSHNPRQITLEGCGSRDHEEQAGLF